jgi:hypothetical protein
VKASSLDRGTYPICSEYRSNAQRCDRVGRCSVLVQLRRRCGVDAWLGKRQMDRTGKVKLAINGYSVIGKRSPMPSHAKGMVVAA